MTGMGVYFRTGQNSAAGVPWWVYFLFILPAQAIGLMVRLVWWGMEIAWGLAVEGAEWARERRKH